jgi:hypothetical protein
MCTYVVGPVQEVFDGQPQAAPDDGAGRSPPRDREHERSWRVGRSVPPPPLDEGGQRVLRDLLGSRGIPGFENAVAEDSRREVAHGRVQVHVNRVPGEAEWSQGKTARAQDPGLKRGRRRWASKKSSAAHTLGSTTL